MFPSSLKETLFFVKPGASSLNFPQADRPLVLEVAPAPPPSPPPAQHITKIAEFINKFKFQSKWLE